MRTLILAWTLIVASAVVANAQEASGSDAYRIDTNVVVTVPTTCHLDSSAMVSVHLVMCSADTACTQRVVEVLCRGAK